MRNLELTQQLRQVERREKEVNKTLENTKSAMEAVIDQVDMLKRRHEILFKKREKKEAQNLWLINQKAAKFGEDLLLLKQVIEDTEEAVTELTQKICELEEKIRACEDEAGEMKSHLQMQQREKDQLQFEMSKIEKEKNSLESTLKEKRRHYQEEIQRLIAENKRQEVGHTATRKAHIVASMLCCVWSAGHD